jgi:KipI family sensor histidine kinase inhibitor
MTLSALGDSAIVITLAEAVDEAVIAKVRSLAQAISAHRPRGVVDVLPAFASVTVYYDPGVTGGFAPLAREIEETLRTWRPPAGDLAAGREHEIPVCYGGEFGPDLGDVAARHRLSPEEVTRLHTEAGYLVQAVGFLPGFAYLGGLPDQLVTPRRSTPRTAVPAGAVGIGGAQTGVYPQSSPGGWNLIGRTAVRMFDPARAQPARLGVGDRVKFRAVSSADLPSAGIAVAAVTDAARAEGGVAAAIEIIEPGMLTSVQDLGRLGHRAAGVGVSGAADSFALRVANLLVGNSENTAGLEFTLIGAEILFLRAAVIAVGGAAFEALPAWRPVEIAAGTRIKFGPARSGCRGYLAIAGGIDVPEVLGSRSTQLRVGLGGFHGRALASGDTLPVGPSDRHVIGRWQIDARILPAYSSRPVVRVVRGAQADEFGAEFFRESFAVSPQSDRMGARLRGPAIRRNRNRELISAAVVPGTIQVPPDGQPIVLLADAQTLGGYPQIAHVITVDLPLVAQLRPGDHVSFREVTLDEAQESLRQREHALALLRQGLAEKLR